MRSAVWSWIHRVSLAGGLTVLAACGHASAPRRTVPAQTHSFDVVVAREFDQQGVRAFAESRFRDALRYFDEAARHGGPPSELWNIARCHEKLDEPAEAAAVLTRYVDERGVKETERDEARRMLEELQRRPTRLTVLSTPPGALVYVDDRRGGAMGRTPTTFELAAGEHSVTIELAGYAPRVENVLAPLYGRITILETPLTREGH